MSSSGTTHFATALNHDNDLRFFLKFNQPCMFHSNTLQPGCCIPKIDVLNFIIFKRDKQHPETFSVFFA